MPYLAVCSLARLHPTVTETGARRVVTLINAGTPVERPHTIHADDHLFLGMNDIAAPMDGMITPGQEHVARLIEFVRAWDRAKPLVIHCYAGVSRSTAAAFTTACALAPGRDEAEIARAIRMASPTATPNPLVVAHADRMLGREGRMVRAVEAIGRGADCFEGVPFRLMLG
jgi:predicted protein tyrosine phosphatase